MWIVCKLVADRTQPPQKISGTWPNGQTMEGLAYPDTTKPMIELFGKHDRRDEAVKALVIFYHPELKDSSIEHLRRVSKNYTTGSMKMYKIVKQKT